MAAGIGQWRRAKFFEQELAKTRDGKVFDNLKKTVIVTSASSNGVGGGQLFFGSPDGVLSVVNRDYEVNICLIFSHSLQLLAHSNGGDTLVAVGMEESDTKQTMKLFRTSDSLIEKDSIQAQKTISFLSNEHPESKITAIAITDRQMVLGCQNGSIYYLSSNSLIKDKRLKFSPPIFRAKTAITNLQIAVGRRGPMDLIIYATTESSVHSFRLIPSTSSSSLLPSSLSSSAAAVAATVSSTLTMTLRERRPFNLPNSNPSSATPEFLFAELESDIGCIPGCAVLITDESDGEQQFVISSGQGIIFYVGEDRRSCLAIEGEKLAISCWLNYLIVVTKENRKMALSTTMPSNNSSSTIISQLMHNQSSNDLQTLTIYSTNPQFIAHYVGIVQIQCIINEWGIIHILSGDGDLFRLIEKDLHTRLNLLFRQNCYPLALQLAKKNRTSKQGMAEIFKQFGDHLYLRNEYESATEQYCKTIGFLEPSYVIKRFLDSQHIDHLTRYLEELHREKSAKADHTTLLLNCYTKHPDRIKRLGEFIGLKDDSAKSVDKDLSFDVDIAIDVCRQAGYAKEALALSKKYSRHDKHIKIQIENSEDYQEALNYINTLNIDDAIEAIRRYGKTLMKGNPKGTTDLLKRLRPTDQQIEDEQLPQSFFNIFMNNSDELLDYLNHAIKNYPKERLHSTVYDSVLELLLQKLESTTDAEQRKRLTNEILRLLENTNIQIDRTRAMVLCQKYEFKDGILSLYDREEQYQQILQYQMNKNDHDGILRTCQKYGDKDSQLWIRALGFFAKSDKSGECRKQMEEILKSIDEKDLLSPLLVVQTLSKNESATLELLKDYLIRKLSEEQDQIKKDQEEIENYRRESESIFQKITKLENEPFLCQDPKCSACKVDLDLPCIHFFCNHSFHEHCVFPVESATSSEVIYECPLCSGDNRKLLDLISNQSIGKNVHETFHRQLEESPDKFGVIAEFLGRRLFDKRD